MMQRPLVPGSTALSIALSVGQEALWRHAQAHPQDHAYHLPFPFHVTGPLDGERLRAAFAAVVARHPVLGACIRADAAGPRLHWATPAAIPVTEHAVEGAPGDAIGALLRRPFALTAGPLARVEILRAPGETRLLLAVHHLVFDGASLPILLADLMRAWAGRLSAEPDLRLAGYAERQRAMLAGPDGARHRAFWRDYLAGELPELDLPAAREEPAPHYCVHRAPLPGRLRDAVTQLARRQGVTSNTVLLGAFQILLRRYGNHDDLIVGVPYQGVRGAELADCVGYLNNMLPVRARLDRDATGADFLRGLRADMQRCMAHGDYPYAHIVRDLGGLGGRPLFRAAFVPWRVDGRPDVDVQAVALPGPGGGCTLRLLDVAQEEEFPLTLLARAGAGETTLLWKTREGAVAPSLLPAMAGHFEHLLDAITADPDRRLGDCRMLDEAERRRIVVAWNRPSCPVDGLVPVHRRFERQAAATPDADAVRCGDQAMSYAALNRAANRLARDLLARGLAPEATVGVCLERSLDLVVALLAVLKAGCAYVPIDPGYPTERVRFVSEDARLQLLITTAAQAPKLPAGAALLRIDDERATWMAHAADDLPGDGGLDALAWVLYTSGSTGRPKGVAIEHRGASALFETARHAFDDEDRRAVLASSSLAFDLGGFEIWLPLCCGGTAVLVRHVLDLLAEGRPHGTLMSTVPSAMRTLLEQGFDFAGVRVALLAGERLSVEMVRALHQRAPALRVYDAYGPTETTTFSTLTLRSPGDPETIGRPVGGTQIHLLDGDGQPVPVGAVGEIHIAGLGVARGYHHQPERTAERFVRNPLGDAASPRVYRTGDLGRWLPDGRIAFHGRRDHQVKLRGQRIELDEIDAVLEEHPRCRQAVTMLRTRSPGDAQLATFVVVDGVPSPALAEQLRAHLARRLPAYMVPARIELVDELVRTPSGKVDRPALAARAAPDDAPEPPRSATERRLAALWSDLLGAPVVDRRQDFFALGGHSLLAAALFARIAAELGVELPWRTLFERRTLAALALAVDEQHAAGAAAAAPTTPTTPIRPAGDGWLPLAHAQRRAWFFEQLHPGTATYHVPCHADLDGPLDVAALRAALRALVHRQAALRLVLRRAPPSAEQRALPALDPSLELHDLSALPGPERDAALDRLADDLATRRFVLDGGPLFRVALVRLAGDRHRLFATFHHLVVDGPSLARFHDELWTLYQLGPEAGARALPALPIRFTDYAAWQDLRARDGAFADDCAWWQQELAGAPPALALPGSTHALPIHGVRHLELAREVGEAVDALGATTGTTRFTVVLAAVAAVLSRATLDDDLVIGAAVSNRRARGVEDLIGFFVNPLPLRVRVPGDPRLIDLVARLGPDVIEGLAHQDAPFELYAERVHPGRAGGAPVFQVMLVMVDLPDVDRVAGGLRIGPLATRSVSAKFPLTLYVRPGLRAWTLEIEYDAARFDAAQIDGLGAALATLLRHPYQRLATLSPVPVLAPAVRAPDAPGAVDGDAHDGDWRTASPHHERLAFIERFEDGTVYPGPPTYHNLPCLLTIDGAPDRARLDAAVARLVGRHEALRTNLVWQPDGLRRRVHADGASDRAQVTWLAPADARDGRDCSDALTAWIEGPLRLATDRLFRVAAQPRADGRTQLALVAHRAIADRASLRVLADELVAELGGAPAPLPASGVASDAADAQARATAGDVAFWRWLLRGTLPPLALPEQRRRAAIHVFEAETLHFALPGAAVRALAATEGVAEADVVLAALFAVVALHAGQRDLVIGMVDARRDDDRARRAVGPLDNLLVLRSVEPGPTFRALLRDTAELVATARRHGALPFDTLVRLLDPEKDMSRTALFDVLFEYASAPRAGVVEPGTGHGKYDLHVQVHPTEAGGAGRLVFNRLIYGRAAMERLAGHLARVLEQAAATPGIAVDALDPLAPDERRRLLDDWNATAANAPGDATIFDLFDEQAARRPAATALSWEGRRLSYRELAERAERCARGLAARGVGRGDLVAILLDRSFDLVAAILGVLRAGAAYLPLDPATPPERLAFILADAAPRLLVVADRTQAAPPGFAGELVTAAELPAAAGALPAGATPDDLAYCIYTSGTTGQPKGVLVTHRNVVRLVRNDRFPFSFGPDDVWTLFHAACFDFSVWELFGALAWGGAVVIVPEAVARDPQRFWSLLQRERVTVCNQTPGAFAKLAQLAEAAPASAVPHLRYVIFGGEKLQPRLLAGWRARHPDVALVNMYGITETTVHVTVHHLGRADLDDNASNIGVPLPTTTVRLLDRHTGRRLVPIGAVGEIYVGGAGVAAGYLRRPELDAARFVPDPVRPGERLYRSGDLARYHEDGTLEFIGRADDQVKLRGYRIEPAEIEVRLREHPAVREAVVLLDERGGGRLVAYVRPAGAIDAMPAASALRAHLAAQLPSYMIPAELVAVDRIPLTINGKVDRVALRRHATPATPATSAPATAATPAPPSTSTAIALAAIWREVLALPAASAVGGVGDDDSFFEAGGHSLLVTELVLRIEERLGVALPLRCVFEHPRLGELAARIDRERGGVAAVEGVAPAGPANATGPLSSFQERIWFLHQVEPRATTYLVPLAWRLARPLDLAALERAFALLVERHEILRTRFVEEPAGPVARVDPPWAPALEIVDLRGAPAAVHPWLHGAARRPIDPAGGRLVRPALVLLDGGEQILFVALHHLIWDGGSLAPLVRALDACYRAALGSAPPPPAPPVQYRDYVVAERADRARGEHEADLAWWEAQLQGAPALALPAPPRAEPDGVVALPISPDAADSLRRIAAEQGATIYMVLAAAVAAVLHRWCGQDDLLLGSPAANRADRRFADLLGPCVDTVALRSRCAPGDRFSGLLARLRDMLLAAQEHPRARFERVVERVNPPRRPGRIPLVDAMVTLDVAPRRAPALGGVPLAPIALGGDQAKFDLTFAFTEDTGLAGALIYRGDRLAAGDAARLAGQLAHLLATLPAALHHPITELDLLDPAERAVLRGFEQGPPADDDAPLVADAVARRALAEPDAPAVISPHGALSYAELERRARALAARFEELPGDPAAPIALVLPRGPDLVIAMLATWRAHRPFCPIDPAYPPARLRFLLDDLGAAALVTSDATVESPGVPRLRVDAAAPPPAAARPVSPIDPDALAYILYTSGSSGEPKGVAVRHRSLAQLARWHVAAFGVTASDRASQLASVGFDAMIWETWPYLAAGACVVPWTAAAPLAPDALVAWLAREQITMAFVATPLAEEVWLSPARAAVALRWMLLGGDRARTRPPHDLPYRVANNYGPTECTVVATSHPFAAGGASPIACIGRPIAGTSIYLLDRDGRRAAVGARAEICIGGAGVAQGYWRRPELTAQRFVTAAVELDDRPGDPVRLYRTGDLGRWLPDGTIEFLGRADRQVQVRGRRVEPGEIEAALADDERVERAAVHGFADGPAQLVAYLVARAGGPASPARDASRAVLDELRRRLPPYLIPDAVVWLGCLPTSAHGKVDYGALPRPTRGDFVGAAPSAPPDNDLERRIAAVWCRVLEIEHVGVHDSFFDLGGNSLLLVRLHRELQADTAPALTLAELFQYPTIRGLARALAGAPAHADGDGLLDRARRRREAQPRAQRSRTPIGESHD